MILRRVLLGWEMGAGLGHVRRLVTIARALREDGWQPYFALRDLHTLPEDVGEVAAGVLQAPGHVSQAAPDRLFAAVSYADVMGVCGYANVGPLRATTRGWDSVLRLVQPAIVLADYAPLLQLAAFGNVPVVCVGDGFCVPPASNGGFPRMRRGVAPMWPEELLLANARRVVRERGGAEPGSLGEIMAGQESFVSVVPELDIYQRVRGRPADGALEGLPQALDPVAGHEPASVFVYLPGTYSYTPLVLGAAAASGLRVDAYLYPPRPDLARELEPKGVRLHATPQPLATVLARARAIVHHGGIGTTEQALGLGRPQLVVPKTLEQALNAGLLGELGVGVSLGSRQHTPDAVRAALDRVTTDVTLKAMAAQVAASLDRTPSLPKLAAICERLGGDAAF